MIIDRLAYTHEIGQLLLCELAPSAREVALSGTHLFDSGMDWYAVDTSSRAIELAQSLTSFTATDWEDELTRWSPSDRGLLDHFISHLDNVTHLTLNPCTLSDLSTLAGLKHLTDLVVVVGVCEPRIPVKPFELLKLMWRSSSMKRISVSSKVATWWIEVDRQELEGEADAHGFDFTWV